MRRDIWRGRVGGLKKGLSVRCLLLPVMVAGVVTTGCSGVLGLDAEKRPGIIAFYDDPVVVDVPDTVEVGAPFEVSVRTYGGGCIRKDGTEVEEDGLRIQIRPYDIHSGASICTAELRLFDHRVTVSFGRAGVGEIQVHGWEMPADSSLRLGYTVIVQ